jgi:hypothetical protein
VVLLNPLAPDETTLEAMTRVRGELSAAGFDVVPVQHRGGADPREELESAARDVGALAGFAIFHIEAGEPTGQIIVLDRLRGKVLDQNLPIDRRNPRRTAAVLAVGAVELLKASLAEFWLSPVAPAPRKIAEVPPPIVREPVAPSSSRFGMEAGVAWLYHPGKMSSVVSPMLKVSYRASDFFAARVAVSTIGIGSHLDAVAGSALIGQELGTVDALFFWPSGSSVRALASAGIGVYHVHVQGIGAGSRQGLTGSSWSLALMPGLGLRAGLGSRVALTAEGQVLFALPSTVVRVGTREFGPAGDPSLVLSGGLVAIF